MRGKKNLIEVFPVCYRLAHVKDPICSRETLPYNSSAELHQRFEGEGWIVDGLCHKCVCVCMCVCARASAEATNCVSGYHKSRVSLHPEQVTLTQPRRPPRKSPLKTCKGTCEVRSPDTSSPELWTLRRSQGLGCAPALSPHYRHANHRVVSHRPL